MPDKKRTSADKRAKRIRGCTQSDEILKDWERLERSGKHDMHGLKEAMLLLVANDGPLPPEWKDHELQGNLKGYRECHIKGDLLLAYQIVDASKTGLLVFMRACTHSEIFA